MRKTCICKICGKETKRELMDFTTDCQGIPYRRVCFNCYDKAMERGYDGQYYDEKDECIEGDY